MRPSNAESLLVIVSCGRQKIWDRLTNAGPTPAQNAYTSPVFKAGRRYAETFADRWVILSAKYGFIDPEFPLRESYNVTFRDPSAITISEMAAQVRSHGLDQYSDVAVIGSFEYCDRIAAAFSGLEPRLHHINGGVGFPPCVIRLLSGLIQTGTWLPPLSRDSRVESRPGQQSRRRLREISGTPEAR